MHKQIKTGTCSFSRTNIPYLPLLPYCVLMFFQKSVEKLVKYPPIRGTL